VARVNIEMIIGFEGLYRDVSMIRSLEKNPAIKGSPQRAKLAISRADIVRGIWCDRLPMERRS